MTRFESDNQEYLVPPRSIPAEIRRRFAVAHFKTVSFSAVAEYEQNGWFVEKRMKTGVRMRKPKDVHERFRDRAWAAFAKLGFAHMNNEQGTLPWVPISDSSRSVEIFAADEEVALIALCRSFDDNKNQSFKEDIAFIEDNRDKLIARVRAAFPGRKIRFLLVTNNCEVTPQTERLLGSAQIAHMDHDTIEYYIELAEHLGKAAKYQILGSLFANQKIPELDPRVAAIEARMGGHTYYSFVIEPERLLKVAYILHRTRANRDLMPTYQRLIKRPRLKVISKFVEDGGFFPNCLILNIDSGGRRVKFDLLGGQLQGAVSRVGILHLPQKYRAAFVIDGQHRLYGYANSKRAGSDLIPVVAFVDLKRSDQVRLFMEINEYQQAVPKALRLTLNADLLSDSPDLSERVRSLILQIAQHLGESRNSVLCGRILIGESTKSPTRCITIDAVRRGIERANYLGTFSKTQVLHAGTFYRGSNDQSFGPLANFIEKCLMYVRDGVRGQWDLGSSEGGFIFINNGVEAMLRIFSDAVDHVVAGRDSSPFSRDPDRVFEEVKPLLDPMITHLHGLSPEERLTYRKQYGSGGAIRYWRRLQIAIHESVPDFKPPGLEEYIANETKQFNKDSVVMVRELEDFLKSDVRKRLEGEYGNKWFKLGVPAVVRTSAGKLAVEKNAELDLDEEVEEWDCLYLVDYQKILVQNNELWKKLFEKRYTKPGDEHKRGSWKERTNWIGRLNKIRNDIVHGGSVREDDYEFLVTLKTWLVEGKADNYL
ncbi:DGQHR domain-containing protein [Nocardia sp. NPDC051787]|uniref:DGQHR domain-containing protein n=1 Tax=Nocardia sp. NPDC051787 TaxID=3155415 RepID=UPI00343AB9CF